MIVLQNLTTDVSIGDFVARARLDGALLAARTAGHLINNDLTTTIGLGELIRVRTRRGEQWDPRLMDDLIVSAMRAARHLQDLQQITHLEVTSVGDDRSPILDLQGSQRPAPRPH